MIKGRTTLAAMTSVLMLGSASAHALESGFYAGLRIGQADHDWETFEPTFGAELTATEDTDSKDTAYGIFGGYQFGRWFGVEGAFDHLGTSRLDYFAHYQDPLSTFESQGSVEAKTNAFSVAGLLTIPLGDAGPVSRSSSSLRRDPADGCARSVVACESGRA
jgi:Outer membrane protein beta-barrel domain